MYIRKISLFAFINNIFLQNHNSIFVFSQRRRFSTCIAERLLISSYAPNNPTIRHMLALDLPTFFYFKTTFPKVLTYFPSPSLFGHSRRKQRCLLLLLSSLGFEKMWRKITLTIVWIYRVVVGIEDANVCMK